MRIIWSQRKIKRIIITFLFIIMASLLSHLVLMDQKITLAADKSAWQAGNIISDSIFTDSGSMSEADIQSFLDEKIGFCDIWGTQPSEYGANRNITRAQYAASVGWSSPPYTCLNKYYEVPKTSPSPELPVNNYSNPDQIPDGAKSAAWIIKDAATRYGINPKVLLVKIATESSGPLTTDQWPLFSQYRHAMGSHCPDSGPGGSANCDPNYSGFSIQMYSAAELLRWYLDSMGEPWWPYKKPYQTNSILWNVAPSGCGASDVYIQSKATAALYTYTPYQPNQAALDNMYGFGDGCSAYGNRNFWRVFVDWFGSTQVPTKSTYLPNGEYYISSIIDTNKAIGFTSDSVLRLGAKSTTGTILKLSRNGDYYTITDINSGKLMSVADGTSNSSLGSTILQSVQDNSDKQNWFIQNNGNGTFTFSPQLANNLSLDLPNASVEDGISMQLYNNNNTGAQRFYVVPITQPISTNIYTVFSQLNPSVALDAANASSTNGTNVQIYADNLSSAQQWQLTYNDINGYYSIVNHSSQKALDVSEAGTSNGTNVQIWESNNTCAQNWRIYQSSVGIYEIISACTNKALDIANAGTSNGTNVQIWESNNTSAQKWEINEVNTKPIQNGVYSIDSKINSNMSLDAAGAGVLNGTNVQIWESNNTSAQKWEIAYNESAHYYAIININSGTALDVSGAGVLNGTNVQIWESNNTSAQGWYIRKRLDDTYELISAHSKLSLDINGGKISNGTNVQIWSKNSTSAQRWIFTAF